MREANGNYRKRICQNEFDRLEDICWRCCFAAAAAKRPRSRRHSASKLPKQRKYILHFRPFLFSTAAVMWPAGKTSLACLTFLNFKHLTWTENRRSAASVACHCKAFWDKTGVFDFEGPLTHKMPFTSVLTVILVSDLLPNSSWMTQVQKFTSTCHLWCHKGALLHPPA